MITGVAIAIPFNPTMCGGILFTQKNIWKLLKDCLPTPPRPLISVKHRMKPNDLVPKRFDPPPRHLVDFSSISIELVRCCQKLMASSNVLDTCAATHHQSISLISLSLSFSEWIDKQDSSEMMRLVDWMSATKSKRSLDILFPKILAFFQIK